MKVLEIISDFSVGGAEKVTSSLANGLVSEKNEITLLIFNNIRENHILSSINKSVSIISLNKENISKWQFLFSLIRFLLFKGKYDIIIGHLQPVAYYLGILLPFLKTPVIYVAHNEYVKLKNPLKKRIIASFYGSSRVQIVSVSKGIAAQLEKDFGIKTTLIINGTKKPEITGESGKVAEEIRRFKKSERTIVFIAVSRLVWFKNLPLLARSFKELKIQGKDAILIILGEDPDNAKKEYDKIIQEDADNVFLLGSRSNVADYLVNSDCFCQVSSGFEGTPIALIEALAMGLPVIASGKSGLASVISDRVNGILCDADQQSILAALLTFLEMNEEQTRNIRGNNARLFTAKFDESIMISSYNEVIMKLLK